LLELLTSVKVGLRRYEHLQVGQDTMLRRAAEEHEQIAQCVLDGDIDGAVAALKKNWHSGMQRILELMDDPPTATSDQPPAATGQSDRWWLDG
jgi:DNA-binding GntR family transcriptional regulator